MSKTFNGNNNQDNSHMHSIANTKKKSKIQYKIHHSFNKRRRPHISGSDASYASSIGSLPSIPSDSQRKPQFSDISTEDKRFISDFVGQLAPKLKNTLFQISVNLLNGGIPMRAGTSPRNISGDTRSMQTLRPILLFAGFTSIAAKDGLAIGTRLVFNDTNVSKIEFIVEVIEHNKNNHNNNEQQSDNKENESKSSEATSAFSSSSFSLSHYSCDNMSNQPLVEDHAGHNHGDNSTCFSGYSSAEYHASRELMIITRIRKEEPIEIYIDILDDWKLFRFRKKGNNFLGDDGTYYSSNCGDGIVVGTTLRGKTKERLLKKIVDFIRVPETNKNNNDKNKNNNNNTMDLDQ